MAIDPRVYVNFDKRHPASLTGDAGKVLAVNSAEDGYEAVSSSVRNPNEITGGDATVSGNTITFTPCSAWDSTRLVLLATTEDVDVDLPETASATQIVYFIFLVQLAADSSCEFRAYTAKTGTDSVEEDAEVSYYRYRTFWRTFTDGVAVTAVLTGSYLTFGKSSQCMSTVGLTVLFASVDHSDLLDDEALELIWYGSKDPSNGEIAIYSSLDGTNFESRGRTDLRASNTDVTPYAWGDTVGFEPYIATRMFKLNSASSSTRLLYRAVKLKL